MADDEAPEVDPRFDPVFQRGYDPAVHAPVARRSVLRTPAAVPAPLPEPAAAAPAVSAPVSEAPPVLDEEAEDAPSRRNPWLLALLLVSIAFLVIAGTFLWAIGQRDIYSYSAQPSAGELMLQQLWYQLPPGLITAGLLGIVLRIALGAIKGRA